MVVIERVEEREARRGAQELRSEASWKLRDLQPVSRSARSFVLTLKGLLDRAARKL